MEHEHRHVHDRGPKALLRYLRWAPRMWRSEINAAVVDLVAPRPGERVLDIGAGMGAGCFIAARAGADVTAVEPAPFMRVVLTFRRLAQRARKKVVVVAGAAEQLPVADRTIDALWATNTMHHWTDADRAAAEIGRVLAPGGRLVLVDEDFDDPAHPDHDEFGSDHGTLDDHGFHKVDADRMELLLSAAGLIDIDTTTRSLANRPVVAITARTPLG